jgi:multiple sugar transport system substrate-binding protein
MTSLPLVSEAGLTRRQVLKMGGMLAAGVSASSLLAACGKSSSSTSSSGGKKSLIFSTPTDATSTINLFKTYCQDFAKSTPGTSVSVVENGSGNFDQWLQAHLAAHNAPDVLRMTPTEVGPYIANGSLIDIKEYLPSNYGDDFNPTFWSQVAKDDKVYGVPQCVDTTAIYYRTDMLSKIDARIPTSPTDAWTWDEFIDIGRKVKAQTGKYAFSFDWGPEAGYYWLPVLYQHGGALVESDLKTPAIQNAAGVEAIEWTRQWFTDGLISPSNSMQASTETSVVNLFTTGIVGMMVNGDWELTNVQAGGLDTAKWDVTYLFRDKTTASLVGGTLMTVSKDSKYPEEAAKLAAFLCSPANMSNYCAETLFLPARDSLNGTKVNYSYRPEAVRTFVSQTHAIPKAMFSLQTSENFSAINDVLSTQLALCFTGQQSASKTAQAIASGIQHAVS